MKKMFYFLLLIPLLVGCSNENDVTKDIGIVAVQLDKSVIEMAINDTYKFSIAYSPADAEKPSYSWSSMNGSVVAVTSEGDVTALSAGETSVTLKATTSQGKVLTDKCVITVVPDTEKPELQKIPMPSLGVQGNDIAADDFDLVVGMGTELIRRGFIWESIEKQVGVYDFSDYDIWVETALNKGFKILVTMAFNNTLYESDGVRAIRTHEGRQAFAKFAKALVEHYKGHKLIYEIWNEPNTMTFWDKNNPSNTVEYAEQYVALVNTTVPKMREADPSCKIWALSMSAIWDKSLFWMDQCGALGLFTSSGIDGITIHPYGFTWPELTVEREEDGYKPMFDILKKHGASDLPIFNGEIGYSIEKLGERVPSDEVEKYQAWMFIRRVMLDWMWGIKLTSWYRWSTVDESFTIVRHDGSLRPTYYAYKNLSTLLKDYYYTKRMIVENPSDYVLVLENDSDNKFIVAWTTPTQEGAYPHIPHVHTISLPVEAAGNVTVYDYLGTESSINIVDGEITVQLDGGPKFIKIQ